jgi:Pyruvate/2-oxoacid:ferredoxin oxidoreductase delta subunit
MSRPSIIVSAQATSDVLNALEQAVIARCRDRGWDCLLIPHLYHISESNHLRDNLAGRLENAVLLCWLHPRPTQWLLRRHQIAAEGLTTLNLGNFSDADSVVSAIISSVHDRQQAAAGTDREAYGEDPAPGTIERFQASTHPRWYPVVDGSRCVNCQHCLQFCLFGVYALDAQGRVAVCNPDHCKPGCPACARICPQSAIMFPLHENNAAIAGAPGQFVAWDAAARRIYYSRTRQPCPTCGRNPGSPPATAATHGSLCPECGRPQPVKASASGAAQTAASPPFDDLDDLIDRLERQVQGRP